jgi:hypothetical protein
MVREGAPEGPPSSTGPYPTSLDATQPCVLSGDCQWDGPVSLEGGWPTRTDWLPEAPRLVVTRHWAWGSGEGLSRPILGQEASLLCALDHTSISRAVLPTPDPLQ